MSHYISRDDGKIAAWEILNGMGISQKHNDKIVAEVEAVFDDIPACDVACVRRGRWKTKDEKSDGLVFRVGVCSVCGHTKPMKIFAREDYAFNYCPNCGARMEANE